MAREGCLFKHFLNSRRRSLKAAAQIREPSGNANSFGLLRDISRGGAMTQLQRRRSQGHRGIDRDVRLYGENRTLTESTNQVSV
jgi:hypothetical protein